MSSGPASLVLRNVVLQDTAHALARPRGGAAQGASPDAAGRDVAVQMEQRLEQAFAEGYRQAAAAAASQVREAQAALQATAEEARRTGFEQGRSEGLRRGEEEAQAQLQQLRQDLERQAREAVQAVSARLQQLARELREQRAQLVADAEDELVALAHAAVCAMLGRRGASPDLVRANVRELLEEARLAGEIRAHVHPEDCALLADAAAAREGWTWVADADVKLGGVHLRGAEASLDARLETQLASLRERLVEIRRQRRAVPDDGERHPAPGGGASA